MDPQISLHIEIILCFDTFMYMLTFLPKNKCAVCSTVLLEWEEPYLIVECTYTDSPQKNGKYFFCSKECSAHANLPKREKMITKD